MSDDLSSKTCTPCRGGIPPLTRAEAEGYLQQASGWALVDDDPEITFGWGRAKVSWHTKKINGLHENDFIMAAKTDQLSGA